MPNKVIVCEFFVEVEFIRISFTSFLIIDELHPEEMESRRKLSSLFEANFFVNAFVERFVLF
jgi:hypothetical protein